MAEEPLVSVVIPSFNRAYCIEKTVDSALAQTHRRLELLVVDDGSSDDTRAVIERAYGNEPRVRYLHQHNQGVSAARNHGLDAATGDFVALLDSDDLWLPWKIEAQLRCLERLPEAGMIWTDMSAMDPTGKIVHPRYLTKMYSAYEWFSRDELFEGSLPFAELNAALAAELGGPKLYFGDIFSEMVLGNLVHTSTVLLRRERADRIRFDRSLKGSGEDYAYHLHTCRAGPVAYLDVASILYLTGAADQLTTPKYRMDMARNFLATIKPVIENDRARIRLPEVMIHEALADAHGWLGEVHYEMGEHRAAFVQLATSLRHKPKQPRRTRLLALSLLPPSLSRGALGLGRRFKKRFMSAS